MHLFKKWRTTKPSSDQNDTFAEALAVAELTSMKSENAGRTGERLAIVFLGILPVAVAFFAIPQDSVYVLFCFAVYLIPWARLIAKGLRRIKENRLIIKRNYERKLPKKIRGQERELDEFRAINPKDQVQIAFAEILGFFQIVISIEAVYRNYSLVDGDVWQQCLYIAGVTLDIVSIIVVQCMIRRKHNIPDSYKSI